MFDDATQRAIAAHAARLNIEEAALLAVVEVESAGHVYATVAGRQEPLIRFEGHYFDDCLTGEKQAEARALGLAHPSAGRVGNPASQAKRWSQLYLPASQISARAAFESTSWGVGQVMGAHWRWLGYASPAAMLKTVRSGAAGQVEVMVRYIEKAGLIGSLQRLDFAAFARGYNGPAYAKYGYHTKMKRAYESWAGKQASSAASGMLRMGSTGAKVRELQALLVRAGHAVNVDGDFGPATQRALMAFQKANKLTVDGVAGPETFAALSAYKVAPEEKP
ncbi:N-acetylmuramidase domain-containing protein, partial [Mesorhizobium sp. Z1-4]|uniref:N-acetylmuramidase domain-containing protein n=1 Tax=Mesorhizobium sp. Z1-4 TaxID=2448478 RepID=UPI0013E008CF